MSGLDLPPRARPDGLAARFPRQYPGAGTAGAGHAHLAARRLASLCAMQYPFLSRLNPSCPGGDDNQTFPGRGSSASTDGPAPDTTAGMPASRSPCRPERRFPASPPPGSPGAASPGSRRAARPLVSGRRAGSCVSAATSRALRPALAAASRCGTRSGSRRLATSVRTGAGATHTTGLIDGSGSSRTIRGWPSAVQAMVSPPPRQAATLSGCPSSSVASPSRAPAGNGPAVRGGRAGLGQRPRGQDPGHDRGGRGAEAAAVRDPVHAAEPDARRLAPGDGERRPHRPHDQVLLARLRPGPRPRRRSRWTARTRQTHASTSSCRPSASPSASKPGPRLALVAGTRTRTRLASRPSRSSREGDTATMEHRCRSAATTMEHRCGGGPRRAVGRRADGAGRAGRARPGLGRWRRRRRRRRWWPGRGRRTAPSPDPSGRCR